MEVFESLKRPTVYTLQLHDCIETPISISHFWNKVVCCGNHDIKPNHSTEGQHFGKDLTFSHFQISALIASGEEDRFL